MIVIAGKIVRDTGELSRKLRTVIGLVEDAVEWLEWAVSGDSSSKHYVDSEDGLLELVCFGLHGSGLIKVDQLELLVHPTRLMEMSEDDLDVILSGKATEDDGVHGILEKHGLATRAELLLGADMLRGYDLQDHILFQAVSLADQIHLYRLSRETSIQKPPKDLRAEAADFASKKAQTPEEFCALYRFYVDAASSMTSGERKGRKALIQEVWSRLAPRCNEFLETFALDWREKRSGAPKEIREYLVRDAKLGFSTKATALQTMASVGMIEADDDDFEQKAERLLSRAKRTILEGDLKKTQVSQDGETFSLVYGSCFDIASVDLKKGNGTVTLGQCCSTAGPRNDATGVS